VDPRDGHDPGGGRDAGDQPADHVVGRGCGGIVVEAHPAHGHAVARRAELPGLVGRVEVVLGGEHLVAGAQAQAAVEQPETHGRAVGQRHVARLGAQVLGGGRAHGNLGVLLAGRQVGVGVVVEAGAVAGDGLGHGAGMGGQHPGREVGHVGGQRELITHRAPVGRIERRRIGATRGFPVGVGAGSGLSFGIRAVVV
jgi:hypothetical protein